MRGVRPHLAARSRVVARATGEAELTHEGRGPRGASVPPLAMGHAAPWRMQDAACARALQARSTRQQHASARATATRALPPRAQVPRQQPLPMFAHYTDAAHRDVPMPAPWSWDEKTHRFPQPFTKVPGGCTRPYEVCTRSDRTITAALGWSPPGRSALSAHGSRSVAGCSNAAGAREQALLPRRLQRADARLARPAMALLPAQARQPCAATAARPAEVFTNAAGRQITPWAMQQRCACACACAHSRRRRRGTRFFRCRMCARCTCGRAFARAPRRGRRGRVRPLRLDEAVKA